jgi:hypothetical protein
MEVLFMKQDHKRRAFLAAVTLTCVHLTFRRQVGLAQISDQVSIEIAIEAVQQ